MRGLIRSVAITVLALGLGVAVGCTDKEAELAAARAAELDVLKQGQESLRALRGEMSELRGQLEAAAEEGEEAVAEIKAAIEKKEAEVVTAADAYTAEVIGFLNKYPMIEGEQPNAEQLAAIRMKSAEDMVLAAEYIEKGGDYRRAMNIYEDSLKLDPDNEKLKAALAQATEMRHMTEERFANVKNGMSKAEVREALGQVNLRNIRDYEDRNVTAWFYPKGDDGSAAAVWFRENRKGEVVVYKTDFNAVKSAAEAQAES